MKFFIFGEELMGTALAYHIQEREGHDVRVFSEKKEGREHLLNMVDHVDFLEEGLRWVGRNGYVICDDEQDVSEIRKQGFKVYGGNAFTKKVENDRVFEMEIAKQAGIKIPNYHEMQSIDEGIAFVKKHKDAWAIKQMGHAPKEWNFVGKDDDGYDTILQLEWIKTTPEYKKAKSVQFMLQEIVEGTEVATSGWWMGNDWRRTEDGLIFCEVNFEHKKMLNDELGISCGEMGTVGFLTDTYTRLFNETVEKLTPILKQKAKDVVLNIDANCGIVDEKGKPTPYLFELTPREGYPYQSLFIHLISQRNYSVSQFFVSLIDKKQEAFDFCKTWGVVTVIGSGTFPHELDSKSNSSKGQPVRFENDDLGEYTHPGYIMYDVKEGVFRIADDYSMVAQVTYSDSNIEVANRKCVDTMKSIIVRAPAYRTDIGKRLTTKELSYLVDNEYIPSISDMRKNEQEEYGERDADS